MKLLFGKPVAEEIYSSIKNTSTFLFIIVVGYNEDTHSYVRMLLGKLIQNTDSPSVGSSLAIIKIVDFYQINLKGVHVVIIGSSSFVGLPLSIHLIHKGASVTIVNEYTEDIQSKTKTADILISACGKAHLVTKEWIKKDTILLDLGINTMNGKLVGDINMGSVKDIASAITPVPGGIGPITTALLLKKCC